MSSDSVYRGASNPPEPEQHSALEGHPDSAGSGDQGRDDPPADDRQRPFDIGAPHDADYLAKKIILPDDAGPHAAALAAVLRRIPPRWGAWIDTDPGWYPLIVDTDTRLAALDPDYVVHQIKEKFGTLRYHCTPSGDDPNPELFDAFDAITDDAEHVSGLTCQRCGAPATPWRTPYRVKTLCSSCADTLGHSQAP